MDKISEAAPGAAGPIDTAAQNVQSNWATIKQIPSNLKRLATDPVQYIKDLPAPSPDQIMTGWAGGGLRSGGLLKGISATGAASAKSPMASMAQQLTQPSSTGGKITTSSTGIKHTADLPVLTRQVEPAAPAVWRNPRTGETSATAPGTKQTTTAGPKETTPADLQKLANVPTSRTNPVNPSAKPLIQRLPGETPAQAIARIQAATTKPMDEEKIVPGTKFPGYWKGRDSAAKSRDRMVGDESIIPSLAKQAKEKTLEWQIEEAYQKFKEQEYTGIDPIVRQRMGMQPATQGQIQSYLDKNPPGIKTGDGAAVTSGSGAPIQSGGLVNVARAADAASPDRALSVAKPPAKPLDIRSRNDGTLPPAPTAAKTPAPSSGAVATPVNPQAEYTALTIPAVATPAATPAPAPYKGSAGSQEIQKLNPAIKDVNKIQVGQTFKMPDGSNYTVKPGDTLDKIARGSNKPNQLSVPPKQLQQITDQPKAAPVKPATPPVAQPQTRSLTTPVKPPADPTAGEAKDKAAQAAADIDPTEPLKPMSTSGVKGGSFTAPPGYKLGTLPSGAELNISPLRKPVAPAAQPNKPGVATSGPLKGINTTPLTRAEKERIDANDRAAAAARAKAGTQKNEAINKLAEQFAAFMEAQDEYGPEYQAMVQRVGQRARQGAMKTVWDPVKRVYKNVPVKQEKPVKEYENAQDQDSQVTSPPAPAATAASQTFVQDKELQNMNAQKTLEADAGAQDPNKQTTSPPSPAAVAKPVAPAAPDVSVATAKTTMAGLKPALGPGVDTNAAATGVTKANLGQQLNPAEQQAVSAITPLVMKAATIPSAAPQLRSALTNAGTMARAAAAQQGKM
jgi:LysM repeat protein